MNMLVPSALEILAKTNEPWVAYKYDAGLKGLSTTGGARVAWRDTASHWQDYRFGFAGNGAMSQPIKLLNPTSTTGAR